MITVIQYIFFVLVFIGLVLSILGKKGSKMHFASLMILCLGTIFGGIYNLTFEMMLVKIIGIILIVIGIACGAKTILIRKSLQNNN